MRKINIVNVWALRAVALSLCAGLAALAGGCAKTVYVSDEGGMAISRAAVVSEYPSSPGPTAYTDASGAAKLDTSNLGEPPFLAIYKDGYQAVRMSNLSWPLRVTLQRLQPATAPASPLDNIP